MTSPSQLKIDGSVTFINDCDSLNNIFMSVKYADNTFNYISNYAGSNSGTMLGDCKKIIILL